MSPTLIIESIITREHALASMLLDGVGSFGDSPTTATSPSGDDTLSERIIFKWNKFKCEIFLIFPADYSVLFRFPTFFPSIDTRTCRYRAVLNNAAPLSKRRIFKYVYRYFWSSSYLEFHDVQTLVYQKNGILFVRVENLKFRQPSQRKDVNGDPAVATWHTPSSLNTFRFSFILSYSGVHWKWNNIHFYLTVVYLIEVD